MAAADGHYRNARDKNTGTTNAQFFDIRTESSATCTINSKSARKIHRKIPSARGHCCLGGATVFFSGIA